METKCPAKYKQPLDSYPTLTQSETLTAPTQAVYPTESGSYNDFLSELAEWPARISLIQDHFYRKLSAPRTKEEAERNLQIHEHCYQDFKLQVEIIDLQLETMGAAAPAAPEGFPFSGQEFSSTNQYQSNKIREAKERKSRLLSSLRFHNNARAIFWFSIINWPE